MGAGYRGASAVGHAGLRQCLGGGLHAAETLHLLQALVPGVRKLAVVSDRAPDWDTVIDRVRQRMGDLPLLSLASVTVSELAQGRSAGLLARPLGIQVSSSLLLSAEVVRHFAWADGAR